MLWEQSMKASEPAQGICGDSTTLDSVQGETLEKSSAEDKTLLLVNISTENHLSPLQSSVARLTRHEPDIERASVPTIPYRPYRQITMETYQLLKPIYLLTLKLQTPLINHIHLVL